MGNHVNPRELLNCTRVKLPEGRRRRSESLIWAKHTEKVKYAIVSP
jgi:hypothetical protein